MTLATGTPGAEIYYTLDGTDPTTSSIPYTAPFTLTSSATVKARAFLDGYNDSDLASAHFTINSLPFSDDFDDGNADGWTVVDDSGNSSDWQVIDGEYQQGAYVESVYTGNPFDGSYHLGTYSFFASGSYLTDYRFSIEITPLPDLGDIAQGNDVGVMFRYLNPDNYYRLTLNSRYGFSRLEKKVAGNFTPLATNSRGYCEAQLLNVTIEVNGSLIQVYLDGDPLFSVSDSSLASGTIALYCQDKAKFDNVLIEEVSIEPSVIISVPVSYSVEVTDTLNVSAFATKVPLDGWIEFVLDDNISVLDDEPPYSTQFSGIVDGEHKVDAVLYDPVSIELTRDTNETIGVVGDYYITLGDSITNGIGDNYSDDNISQDGRIISSQGFQSNLTNILTSTLLYPNIVFNEGIGGDESYDAAYNRIDSILERHPGSNKVLILLGTNDSAGTLPVLSGLGCSGSSCEGTFKGNMQALIDKIDASGKDNIIIGLVPPAFGSYSTTPPFLDPLNEPKNQLIQEYNQVITDELVGHQVGPDFFSFFLSEQVNRFSLFADNLHPNGLGYVVMAHLWHNALTGATDLPFILEDLMPQKYKQNLLEIGDEYYTDRTYTLIDFPTFLESGVWIMTADANADNTSDSFLSFTIDRNVTVYVAYDADASNLPDWLDPATSSFAYYAGQQISTTNGMLNLYYRDYTSAESPVQLGGNKAGGGTADSNYIVIVIES